MRYKLLVLVGLAFNSSLWAQPKPVKVKGANAAKPVEGPPVKEDANAIMEKAEHIRGPSEDYVCSVELLDKKDSKEERRTYESSLKGREKALVKFLTPASEKGTKVLMIGQDMWVQVASSAKPVRISANQKLTGNAAYGDVARLSFTGNYDATLLRSDKLDGKDAYVLELKSKPGRPVTYDLIEYWVEKSTQRPLLAIYKTFSGKPIREGRFSDYKDIFGVQRPTTFTLTNVLQKNHVTTLSFSNNKLKSLPDLMFEKQNLGRN